ncbi:MAG TPA: LysR family transcriptional regulator [Candidatus Pullichristensenella stercorigallinarum]|uniref:LysR family transcriptional regulator n=1 Tax=Candidatus Pullichristensenella stercorigallinarum TaxID=2840909 RepID=A0A9D1CWH0_9FIRM|nr:LysR family transcriptional regulator [Candidatus Pullichristensenella stercorigallinarum]
MNIIQFKYAIEVERTGSISQAAENLYMAQPNLSKAIRELEENLGFAVFERTSRGVVPTRRGEEFLKLARGVLLQVEQMEALRDDQPGNVQRLSLSMPRGSYISDGVARFIEALDPQMDMRLSVKETNSVQTINNVLSGRFRLGIIRYRVQHEAHFLDYLDEKELNFELVWEYDYAVLLSRAHPLANMEPLDPALLEDYIELTHGDKTVPHLSSLPRTAHRPGDCENRRILIYERADQFEILSRIPTTYMWTSPEPRRILEPWNLIQKKCSANRRYRDVLIYPRRYTLSEYDRLFIDKLFDARNDIAFGGDRR